MTPSLPARPLRLPSHLPTHSSAAEVGDRRRSALLVGGLAALCAALVVGNGLESGGLRGVEASSVYLSWRPWSALFQFSRGSGLNGFLYPIGLKIWMIGGSSAHWLRVSSALCVVVAVGVVAWLATRLVNRTAGCVSAAVLVFSGTVLELGQYVRFYAPVMALAACSLAAWSTELGRPRRWSLGIWTLCSLLLVSCSVLAIAVVFGQLLSVFTLNASSRKWRRRILGATPSLIVSIIVIVLSVDGSEIVEMGQVVSLGTVADLLYLVSGSGGWPGLLAYVVVGSVAFGAVLNVVRPTWSDDRSDSAFAANVFRPMITAPWLIVVSGVIVMLGASFVFPRFVARYPAFLLPAAALALGCGIGLEAQRQRPKLRLPRRLIAGVAVPRAMSPLRSNRQVGGVLLLGLTLFFGAVGGSRGWRDWRSSQRVDWEPVVSVLSVDARPNDEVLFGNDSVRLSYDFYLRQNPELILPPSVFGDRESQRFDADEVRVALKAQGRLWLVVEAPLSQSPGSQLAVILDRFDATLIRSFGTTAVLYRIDS